MRDALLGHNDPEIAEWARTKGMDNGERELRRIYDRAPGMISPERHTTRRERSNAAFRSRCAITEVAFSSGTAAPGGKSKKPAYAQGSTPSSTNVRAKLPKASFGPVKPNAQMVADVLDALRAAAQLDAAIEPPAWLEGAYMPPAHKLVACANGLMDLPTGCSCRTRRRSSITTRSTSIMSRMRPSRGNGSISCISCGATIARPSTTLQEIFGYCLTADTSQQKAFAVIGPKRSGKGTIARVVTN